MDIVNRVVNGVHADNDPHYQPPDTMRWSVNGVIMDVGQGNYMWQTMKGTKLSFSVAGFERIMGHCVIRDRFILLVLNTLTDYVKIYDITFSEDGTGTKEVLWSGNNDLLGLDLNYPIRAMFGFYENQEIQRIYWTNYYNGPRVLNIGYSDPLNKTVTLEEKFIEFAPEINMAYGSFQVDAILAGGSLKAGNYFFCWRMFHEDYYTDWSYLSNPVQVAPGSVGSTPDDYQLFQGAAPDEIIAKSIRIKLSDLDDDYDSIQIAAFYSNDYNSAAPGIIFYDGDLTGTTMTVTYNGNENAGSVTIEELIQSTLVIKKCKDMIPIKKRNTISNIETREELDFSGMHSEGKNNAVEANVHLNKREVILDVSGYPLSTWSAGQKALVYSPKGALVNTGNSHLYCGIYYRGVTAGVANYLDLGGSITWTIGEIFKLSVNETSGATCTSGSCEPVAALKKYRKSSAGPIPDWDDYQWNVKSLIGEYLDYKSSIISNMYRSYPGGEEVRFGLVCFDKTGRPYFARWIENVAATSQLGLGDATFPLRNGQGSNDPLIANYDHQTGTYNGYYNQVNGVAYGIKISDLDLTDVINDISGFMIVRVPIARQYIGMGLIKFTYEDTNLVMSAPGWVNSDSDTDRFPGTYAFISPEELFEFKDFSIQPGDKLVNLQYLDAYEEQESVATGYQGYGRLEVPIVNDFKNLYQKFLILNNTAQPDGTNSAIGEEHEILYNTPYEVAQDNITFDPRNEIYQYRDRSYIYDNQSSNYGINSKHNILVLDIDETSDNAKGVHNNAATTPIALLCMIKREISNPYGGTNDSSLSNSIYITAGHFQEINDTVKSEIESGGKYIFNEIEVFGGDSFIQLFDIKHVIPNEDIHNSPTLIQAGHAVIFPIETRMNLSLREGVHQAKERAYHATNNTSGIRYDAGNMKLEEFNYNDGYSSENIDDYYLPLPYNTSLENLADTDIRFSPEKTYGERADQFRVFNVNDKISLDSNYGQINNIRNKFNRLIYWQEDAVGYIPVKERALTQGQFGDPVQLGVGGLFERYDDLTNRVGNSNQFGLVESDMGFHWYDSKRKLMLFLSESLQFSQDSIAKGLNNWLEENISIDLKYEDNPRTSLGICGGYDPYHKVVFYSFVDDSGTKTIGFDSRNQKFMGEFEIPGVIWMRKDNWLFSQPKLVKEVYVHGLGNYGQIYSSSSVKSSITIVVKAEDLGAVVFSNYELIGGSNFFESITIQNSDQTVTETIQEYILGGYRFLNRNYKYRNRRWYGNYPRLSGERFVDGYLIVTFESFPQLTKFLHLKSTIRKAY